METAARGATTSPTWMSAVLSMSPVYRVGRIGPLMLPDGWGACDGCGGSLSESQIQRRCLTARSVSARVVPERLPACDDPVPVRRDPAGRRWRDERASASCGSPTANGRPPPTGSRAAHDEGRLDLAEYDHRLALAYSCGHLRATSTGSSPTSRPRAPLAVRPVVAHRPRADPGRPAPAPSAVGFAGLPLALKILWTHLGHRRGDQPDRLDCWSASAARAMPYFWPDVAGSSPASRWLGATVVVTAVRSQGPPTRPRPATSAGHRSRLPGCSPRPDVAGCWS